MRHSDMAQSADKLRLENEQLKHAVESLTQKNQTLQSVINRLEAQLAIKNE